MQKPSISRSSMMTVIASAAGFALGAFSSILPDNDSPAARLQYSRGKPPSGMRWQSPSVYTPGGERRNTRGTFIKNPKVAAHVQAMHEKWLSAKINKAEVA